MIITKEYIRSHVSDVLNENIRIERFENYGPHDFQSSSTEESFYLILAAKSECQELLTFWVKGLEKIIEFENLYEGESDYLEWYEANIGEVDDSIFHNAFETMTSRLKKNIELIKNPNKYYQVRDEWNEQIYILENESELLMVYWDTTA